MTTGMTKDQTSDLTPRARAPPAQVPLMRRSRSLSELPGSVRVPILRRTDNERMRARLEAGIQGLEELKLLREQQQKQMEEVRNTALQKKPVPSQNGRFSQSQPQLNQRRMSTTSLRLSSQSLARINEEGDDNGGGPFTNGRLQDCTNLGNFKLGHRRHSSFSLEACRNRRPLSTTDTDVFDNELTAEPDMLRKTHSWSTLPANYNFRSVSSESLNEKQNDIPSNQFTGVQNNRRNQRSFSFSAVPGTPYSQYHGRKGSFGDRNNENIEPMLRRGSIQCEAVITGAVTKKNLGIFKDVDLSNISTDSPSPLHAVLCGFKVNQSRQIEKTADKLQNGLSKSAVNVSGSQRGLRTEASSLRQINGSENNLSPRNNAQSCVVHRRALSETATTPRLSKVVSMPDNIHDLSDRIVKSYFQKHSRGSSTKTMNMRNEKHHSSLNRDGQDLETRKYNMRSYNEIDERCSQDSKVDAKDNSDEASSDDNDPERRISEGNVFLDENPLVSPVSETPVKPKDFRQEKNDLLDQDEKTNRAAPAAKPDENESSQSQIKRNQDDTKSARQSDTSSPSELKRELEYCPTSPVQIPCHEKKFSIASDEGYVTSPPSTPRGRHAHSIVSDTSWISTDLDDSPVHVSHDLGTKVTTFQLKRSDFPQDYSKAKLSRRSSDYGSISDRVGVDHRRLSDFDGGGRDARGRVGGAKQELFKYDSCESLPFRQTAV